jgi:hypothetical protein
MSVLICCPFSFTAYHGVKLLNQNNYRSEKFPSLPIWAVYHHCLSGMFTITAHPDVTIPTYLGYQTYLGIIVTTDLDTSLFAYLFILYSCSSLHHPNQLVHLSVPGTSQI